MSGERPRVTIVIPAYNEDEQIVPILDRLFESVRLSCEALVVVDTPDDTTIAVVEEYAVKEPRLRCLINTYGPGPANAIRFGIDSRDGFEIGIELTAKAKRLGRPVAEIPTIWLDRQAGVSNFKVAKWIPSYLRWYRFAFGSRLTADEVRARSATLPSQAETRGK